ncbi:MAG: 16S rRNA (guanine(527)-N(7))-methyltransferase RsmG [Chloroflexi bacterium]|nr:16S rRNA (guanine(527)-N(7))-methyltransferase RsmG [Chloroflexota bacterium]
MSELARNILDKRFTGWAADLGVSLAPEQLDQLGHYLALLLEWNERMNLTAVRDPLAIQIRHFLDSLSCLQMMGDVNGRSLIDIGTGAGFPGLPLKIACPDLQLTLVESVQKKARFLQVVVDDLALPDVKIVAERAELLGQHPAYREQYDWAAARAVAKMPVLAEYLLPLCRIGGHMLAQKGESAAIETAVAESAFYILGGTNQRLHMVQLPEVAEQHYLVVVDKMVATPSRYPRRIGVPAKRPLGR